MAEGTSLLRMHTAYTCIVGSNPTVSARTNKKASPAGGFFICLDGTVGFEGLARAGPALSESPICWRPAPAWRAEGALRHSVQTQPSHHHAKTSANAQVFEHRQQPAASKTNAHAQVFDAPDTPVPPATSSRAGASIPGHGKQRRGRHARQGRGGAPVVPGDCRPCRADGGTAALLDQSCEGTLVIDRRSADGGSGNAHCAPPGLHAMDGAMAFDRRLALTFPPCQGVRYRHGKLNV